MFDVVLVEGFREAVKELTGGKEPIVMRTYGEDLKTLRAKSDQILSLVKSVPGVSGPVMPTPAQPARLARRPDRCRSRAAAARSAPT